MVIMCLLNDDDFKLQPPTCILHKNMRRREEKENTSIMKLNGFYFAPQQFNTRSLRSHTRYVMIWNYFCLKANKYFLGIETTFSSFKTTQEWNRAENIFWELEDATQREMFWLYVLNWWRALNSLKWIVLI